MNTYKPRRPYQLKPEQVERIDGGINVSAMMELAHTTASSIVPLPNAHAIDPSTTSRIHAVISQEGIDVIAETWAHAPADSLPGVLWRGYLLREWIRRFPLDAAQRVDAAIQETQTNPDPHNTVDVRLVGTPESVRALWDEVFSGSTTADFRTVLRESARFTDFIARAQPEWISSDDHPLATAVTRRDTALLRTAAEYKTAGELLIAGRLS